MQTQLYNHMMRGGLKLKKAKSVALTVAGSVLLVLGAIGIVIPGLPTTPFVIFAAICFSAGNNKLASWLERNRIFGPYIENYRTKQGISLFQKVISVIFVWVGLSISMFVLWNRWAVIGLCAVGIAVTIHILKIKTKV